VSEGDDPLDPAHDPGLDTPPPFLGRWSRLYVGVALNLALLILLFYLFRRAFE
jgi:hypothetical protein